MLIDVPQRKDCPIRSVLKENKKTAITRPPWWVTNMMSKVKAPQVFLSPVQLEPRISEIHFTSGPLVEN